MHDGRSAVVVPGLPRLWLTPPGDDLLRGVIEEQSRARFTYAEVGATRSETPPGYAVDCREQVIGTGEEAYQLAVRALLGWRMFDAPWLRLVADGPPWEGQTLAFAARELGVWTVHACRVVYVVEEDRGPVRRLSFAYGTLPRHGLRGEESFVISWNRVDGVVTAGLHQFSCPNDLLTTLAGPLTRLVQRRFIDQTLGMLQQTVGR